MTYTTLAKVKRRLGITSADQDALLSDILAEVDAEIDLQLARFFQVPVQDSRIRSVLDGIEADWVAGRYRMLVEPNVLIGPEGEAREHVLVTDAKRRLRALLDALRAGLSGV